MPDQLPDGKSASRTSRKAALDLLCEAHEAIKAINGRAREFEKKSLPSMRLDGHCRTPRRRSGADMTVPRLVSRTTQHRRTSRLVARFDQVFAAMSQGRSLHLQPRPGGPLWLLSDGRPVPADVAALIARHALVEPADTALFSDLPGQDWRHR